MAKFSGNGDAYFLYHSIGQYDRKQQDITAALADFAAIWSRPDDAQWGAILGQRQRFIDLWSDLIGAAPGTVTTTENVTTGLMSVIGALPAAMLRGKKVLVAEDGFPSLHFLLTGLAERLGFDLVTVPLRQGAAWVEEDDMIAEWDDKVALALLTWISSTSSNRLDIPRLVAHGRAMGSMIGVDLTQGAGLLPYDVTAPKIDFALSTSLKWMCGTPGAGIIYVSPEMLPICEPELRGWFSQEDPFSWALDAFAFAGDARRFNNGTPGTVSAIASLPAMEWRMRQDHAEIVQDNRRKSTALQAGLEAMGLVLASPRDPDKRGGSLMVALPSSTDAAALVATLGARDIHMDNRSQTLRMSPGVLTTDAGIARTLQALAELIG